MYMVIDNPNQLPDLSKSVVCIFMLQTTPLFLFMMVLATRVSHTSSIQRKIHTLLKNFLHA